MRARREARKARDGGGGAERGRALRFSFCHYITAHYGGGILLVLLFPVLGFLTLHSSIFLFLSYTPLFFTLSLSSSLFLLLPLPPLFLSPSSPFPLPLSIATSRSGTSPWVPTQSPVDLPHHRHCFVFHRRATLSLSPSRLPLPSIPHPSSPSALANKETI